uniref:3-oxo-5-alpha-steroid 4-dehydrogenase C-terminal domain-containing protein n=2 Tax=Rhodosorus marinus TaxID=101924 RepID=A0A7S0BNR2_9RHOD|mmetsp:Transcript_24457/g.35308  ORF Transcript_24457/g.35308 Transcript_24457/m.35308 type:complete len:302 (+) Transcript_24457:191-1096(+)
MDLTIVSRSGRKIAQVSLPDEAKLRDLKDAFHKTNTKYYPDRQRFTLPTTSASEKPLSVLEDIPLKEQLSDATVVFKDLGPQISWRSVFVIEYLGPLLIFPIFLMRPWFIYGTDLPPLIEQQYSGFVAFLFHYVKRELETLLVHKFSNSTMPIMNVFKNSIYYWGFAAGIGYFLFHPLYTPVAMGRYAFCMAMFWFWEVANFVTHAYLSSLRPAGTRVRKIPRDGAFEFVSCPNYLFEILAWMSFNLFTSTLVGWAFFVAGSAQMLVWAMKKHKNYQKEFDGKDGRELYPKGRKALIPFIL